MGWIYRDADQHKCPLPAVDGRGVAAVRAGDVWQCAGQSGCAKLYRVAEDQRDGKYLVEVPEDQQEALLRRIGVKP